ncbi:MAG: hypothetical protein RLP02_02985, partial [Coleofasciculus sp. C2-GNP5-27]
MLIRICHEDLFGHDILPFHSPTQVAVGLVIFGKVDCGEDLGVPLYAVDPDDWLDATGGVIALAESFFVFGNQAVCASAVPVYICVPFL